MSTADGQSPVYTVDERSRGEAIAVTILADLVQSYGLTMDEFTDELRDELAARPRGDPRALTAGERDVLTSIGVPARDLDEPLPAQAVTTAAANLLEHAAGMVSTGEMAQTLGRSESRIRGAIADGSLLGVRIGRGWRIPTWQVANGHPIPHLRKVVAAIPTGVSQATIGRVMTTPTDELYLDGQAVSPRDWLLSGGDPALVTAILAALYTW